MINVNNKIKFVMVSIIFTVIYFGLFCNIANAIQTDNFLSQTETLAIASTSDGIPDPGNYKPTIDTNPVSKEMVGKILSILQVIGVIGTVIAIAIIGLKTIFGSAGEKALEKEKYVGILIAVIMITSGITIAKFIISAVES